MKPREEDMTTELFELYQRHAQGMINTGIRFRLNCVVRTHAEQEAFYSQGRENLSDVNAKRMTAGMCAIDDRANVIVTHTKNSLHFPDKNGKSHAYDIELLKDLDDGGQAHWDIKYDGQGDKQPDYMQAAEIGRTCGLECGAFWDGFKDYPHYQLPDKGASNV